MNQRRKSQPSPRPTNPISARLERVRESQGYAKHKDFWRALVADGTYKVSYTGILPYHFNREPPVSYLVRVAEVTGVRLEWLATGREPMRDPAADPVSHDEVDARLDAACRAWIPSYDEMTEGLRRVVRMVWSATVEAFSDGWEVLGLDDESVSARGLDGADWDAAGVLAASIARSCSVRTVADSEDVPLEWWNYSRRFFHAAANLVRNLPPPRSGKSANTALRRLGYVTAAERERITDTWPPYPGAEKEIGSVETFLKQIHSAPGNRDSLFLSHRERRKSTQAPETDPFLIMGDA